MENINIIKNYSDHNDAKCETFTNLKPVTPAKFGLSPPAVQRRHNERDGVSDHWRLDCLLNHLFWRRSKKRSKIRVTSLREVNHRWPVDSLYKGPVKRNMFPFDDVSMRKLFKRYCLCRGNKWEVRNQRQHCGWFIFLFQHKTCHYTESRLGYLSPV